MCVTLLASHDPGDLSDPKSAFSDMSGVEGVCHHNYTPQVVVNKTHVPLCSSKKGTSLATVDSLREYLVGMN